MCAGPWAAAPSPLPQVLRGRQGRPPQLACWLWASCLLPGPQPTCSAWLLPPVLLGLLTINVSVLAVAQPPLPLPMGCEGVSSSCAALGREREVGRGQGGPERRGGLCGRKERCRAGTCPACIRVRGTCSVSSPVSLGCPPCCPLIRSLSWWLACHPALRVADRLLWRCGVDGSSSSPSPAIPGGTLGLCH